VTRPFARRLSGRTTVIPLPKLSIYPTNSRESATVSCQLLGPLRNLDPSRSYESGRTVLHCAHRATTILLNDPSKWMRGTAGVVEGVRRERRAETGLSRVSGLFGLSCWPDRQSNQRTRETRETRQTRSSAWAERVSGSGKKRKTTHMASLRSTKQPAHSAYFPAERNTSTVRRCRKRRPIFFIPSR
jgi:hypothetical protein